MPSNSSCRGSSLLPWDASSVPYRMRPSLQGPPARDISTCNLRPIVFIPRSAASFLKLRRWSLGFRRLT
jgi:hypothetical protein